MHEIIKKRNQVNLLQQEMENVARRLRATDSYNHIAPLIIYDVPREVPTNKCPQAQRALDMLANGWYDKETATNNGISVQEIL